jgi:flagellin
MSVINTNITSMIGQQNLNKSQSALQTSMERLSSGLRINSAKDDAAGQAIANRMSSQITGLAQAQRNANDGISVAQTAEGALNQINDNLQRIRELSVQAENGTNSSQDLDSIQNEINQRLGEINRISDETSFNGTKVLQSDNAMKIQVGSNDGEVIEIGLKEINVKTLGLDGFNVTGQGEIENTAATKDDLTLAGFESQGVTNGVERFTNELSNTAATASDVLGSISTDATVTFSGSNTGLGVAASSDTYTYNADSDSYSFNAQDVAFADVSKRLIPSEAGATNTMTINIEDGAGGGTQEVIVDSDGNLSSADSGEALYLTADGNLSQTNSDGSGGTLARATIDSVLESMGAEAVAAPAAPAANYQANSGTATDPATNTLTFGALSEGQSVTINDLTFTAGEGGATDAEVANAFSTYLNNNDATVAQGEFTGDATGFGGLTDITVSSSTNTLVFTASGGTNDNTVLNAANVGDTNTVTIATDGQDAGTGGNISFNGTTYTADTTAGAFDVKDATISADQLAKQMEGSAFTVNDSGNEFAVAANGSVERNLQALNVTGTGLGSAANAASLSIEFGNMQAGDAYAVDGVTFTASQDVTAEQVATAFESAFNGDTDSDLGEFSGTFSNLDNTNAKASVDGSTLTLNTISTSTTGGTEFGETSAAAFSTNATTSTENAAAEDEVYTNADNDLVTEASSTIERFVQENGTVTDGGARQVFVDQEGELTFDAVTESERSSLSELDNALSTVDGLRSDLGAIQNRMESAIENLSTTETNLSAARSRIEDADYAVEVANMTRAQILQQAGTSVLAQANQIPQSVLSLLG